jgi:putative tributyrin esterase
MASAEIHMNNQNVLGKRMSLKAIIPDSGDGPFPVLYLLHGLSDNHLTWCQLTSIERYVGGLPLIVIMPDGERGFFCDNPSRPFANYETYLIQDVIGFVDRTFKTVRAPEGRAAAGLSMGGYSAAKCALKYPELFCTAASLSGAMAFSHTTEADSRFIEEFLPVLGPDPVGGVNDLFAIAQRLAPDKRPSLLLSCGVDDYLISQNREFHQRLNAIGFPHEYQEHPGAHNWEYWNRHVLDVLAFVCPKVGLPDYNPSGRV